MDTNKVKKVMRQKKVELPIANEDWLSGGATLLNLACSGRTSGAFAAGGYYFFVGDSASGKTFLALCIFAEAARNDRFKKHRFIYDASEFGAKMDIAKFFGQDVANRLEPPRMENKVPQFSRTIDEFYYNLDDAKEDGRPFIYVEDSMDALDSEEAQGKFQEQKVAYRRGKTTAGSYGDGKAKKNSSNLRRYLSHLQKTGSILLVINQTRDNLGFGFQEKTRSGGHALHFYADVVLWSSIKNLLKKNVNGKDREIGVNCRIQVKKNRFTGRLLDVEIPIYWSVGVDEVGSMVDYLVTEKHWKKADKEKGGIIHATDMDLSGTREQLVKAIEEANREKELRAAVRQVWREVREACEVQRKPRYV